MVRSTQADAVEPISIREFARREGVWEGTIRKAIRRGDLVPAAGGGLDPRLVGTRANARSKQPSGSDGVSLAEALRQKENAIAELRKIELEDARGSHAPIEEMASLIRTEYDAVRSRLRLIAGEVAAPVAATSSPSEVQAIVSRAINRALANLSGEYAAEPPTTH